MPILSTRQVALISMMSAATIVVAYSKGLYLASMPGVFEFMTVLIFVTGFSFGGLVGSTVGFIALVVYMLIPFPFAHPAAWLFSISPVLLVVMALLGGMFGLGGALTSRFIKPQRTMRFSLSVGLIGLGLTFIYDVTSSIGFALAYPAFTSVWQSIILTFVPLYYPWPPIVHTFTNAIIFAMAVPVLVIAIKALPEIGFRRAQA